MEGNLRYTSIEMPSHYNIKKIQNYLSVLKVHHRNRCISDLMRNVNGLVQNCSGSLALSLRYDGVWLLGHHNGVMMDAMVSQIPSLTIVNSIVYSGVDQRKH